MRKAPWFVAAFVTLVLAGAGALWWRQHSSTSPPTQAVARPSPAPLVPAPPLAASAPIGIQHPIEVPDGATSVADPRSILVDLFGRRAALSMFNLDDFPRRFAATVDNLGRSSAASSLWPINPAGDKFLTERRGDSEVISADNSLRYTPFVLLVETVDMERAVAAYRKLYPQFQQAYEDLGYPKGYLTIASSR